MRNLSVAVFHYLLNYRKAKYHSENWSLNLKKKILFNMSYCGHQCRVYHNIVMEHMSSLLSVKILHCVWTEKDQRGTTVLNDRCNFLIG